MKNQPSLFNRKNCISISQRISTSTLGSVIGMSSALVVSALLDQHDYIPIGSGEIHPISLLIAVVNAIVAKSMIYKLCCNTNTNQTTAIVPKLDCNDQTRLLTFRYLIPGLLGMLFGLLLSFILTLFIPDDEIILKHSIHLLSSGVASSLATTFNDISNYCLHNCCRCKETRPKHTYTEEDPLMVSINFS